MSEDWLSHALRQAPWRTQTQSTSLVLSVVVLVALIGTLYLAQASRTAAAGRRVQELEDQRQVLEQQNAQLRAEIAALRSVPRLIAQAEALGYRVASVDEVEYITLDGVAPPPPTNPADNANLPDIAPIQPAEPLPDYDESLGSWLAERTGIFQASFSDFMLTTFGIGDGPTGDGGGPTGDGGGS